MMKTYDVEHAAIFPAYWRVNEMLANSYCEGTREDFKGILQRSMRRGDGQTLDVDLLLSCLQETLNFEHSLERRFSNESRSSMDTIVSKDERSHGFSQAISEAFEPYMSLWIESQDKQLSTLIPKYRQQPLWNSEEEFSPQAVIPSSTELFHFYRLTLGQCAKLSTGSRLAELSSTFAKYLDYYGQQVLYYFLSERSGVQGPSIVEAILILNTADYCYATCNQLEEKIRGRIDEEFKEKVDLQSQADAFMGIASATVRVLVRKVEIACEPTWREMRNTPWSKLESVGDQSTYVAELLRHVKETSSEILKSLHKQQYARAFCDNLVDLMANAYIANIVQSKPISEVGAEQMLLDSYVLKKGFTELPILNDEAGTAPPARYATHTPDAQQLLTAFSFVKRVNQAMSRIDPLLKTLQVRPSPPEALVQAYLIHIADKSDTNFRKIMDLKGIRKAEQTQLLDLFAAFKASPSHSELVDNSPFLTPIQLQIPPSTGGIGSNVGSVMGNMGTPSLASGRFDPAGLGNMLVNAARDGVDRFGSPAPGTQQHAEGGDGKANLNDNLKNIGKFFRRDVGGFRGFGKSEG